MRIIRFCNSLFYDKLLVSEKQGDYIMKSAYIYYILALLLFGTNGIVASCIQLTSYEIVFCRTLIGSLLLLGIFLIKKEKWTFFKFKKQFRFLTLSGVAMGLSWMFLYEAYNQIGVSIASLMYYCGPVIVMALSPLLFKERLTASKVLGFLSVLIGIFLVNGNLVLDKQNGFGIFCGLMSAVMYSFMVIFNKKATPICGLENSTLQLSISFLTVAIFLGFKQGYSIQITSSDIFPILFLGIVNTGIGCYLYFSKLGKLPVQSVSVLGYLEPLSAVIFSVLILNEKMGFVQILGAILIIGVAIYAECSGILKKAATS